MLTAYSATLLEVSVWKVDRIGINPAMDRCILRLLLDWCNVVVVWSRSVRTCTVDIAIGLILRCLLSLYADYGPFRIGFMLRCTLEVVFSICPRSIYIVYLCDD